MPDISQMKSSKYWKADDLKPGPQLLNMLNVTEENVAMAGQKPEMKWCLHFSNSDKPMVLNPTNMDLIALATGHSNTDDWAGKQIVLYYDPTIQMGGKIVGGIRARAPRLKNPAPAVPPAPRPVAHTPPPKPEPTPAASSGAAAEWDAAEPADDDVPF